METLCDQARVVKIHGPVVAVSKPSGMRVHPSGEDGVPDLCAWLARQPAPCDDLRPAHRLDAGSSGLVLCAASREERSRISGWFARGEVRKTYLVLVHGRAHRKGVIRRKLPDPRRRHPLPAVTRYRLLEALGGFSLLRVMPESGRKHQVRRHLHGIGLPLVGDGRWRPKRFRRVPAWPGRLWLHAWRLQLPDGELLEAPLPVELERHLAALRQ